MVSTRSIDLYLDALDAFEGRVYPLSSWSEKYAPPTGFTGAHCKQIQPWMLEDEREWSESVEAAALDAGKTPEEAEQAADRWVNVVFKRGQFAFCGYPPAGYVALDVDSPDVIREVERELNLQPGQLESLLKSTPAVINTEQRTLKAHHYLQTDSEGCALLRRMMSYQTSVGHLGDLICVPEPGSSGGRYQKLHGGHTEPNKTYYRMVDADGKERPYSYIREAPELPYELLLALRCWAREYPDGGRVARSSVAVSAGSVEVVDVEQNSRVDDSMTMIFPITLPSEPTEPTDETALEKVDRLFYQAYTQEEQFKLATTDLPAGCKYEPHHSGEHRIKSTSQRSGNAGAVINIHPPDHEESSNIHFYSPNVKEAYLGSTEGSNTLHLSTIATLPQEEWCRSAHLVGRVIEALERKLGVYRHTEEQVRLKRFYRAQKAPTDVLIPKYMGSLFQSQKMKHILRDLDEKFETDKSGKPVCSAENSHRAVRALVAFLASKGCYIQNQTVRYCGQLFAGEDREMALAPVLGSPQLKTVILDNWELFQTEGWMRIITSRQATSLDYKRFMSEMLTYGFYDIHTGQGSTETCFEDSQTGALYVPGEHTLTRIVSGDAEERPDVSKSRSNHAYFKRIVRPTEGELEEVVQQARMLLASVIRFAEQRGPVVYRGGQYSNNPLYKGALMPDGQSRAALLLAFLSESLTARSTAWLHLDGQDSTGTGKSTFMELAMRIIPGAVKTKLSAAFAPGQEYNKQALIARRFVLDDEFSSASAKTVDGMKELITNGVSAQEKYGKIVYYTKPMSIITATNRYFSFQDAAGAATSLERRFLRLPCKPLLGDDDNVDRQYLKRIQPREWEAFMCILAQPYLFGLEHACRDLRRSAGGGEATHRAIVELKEQARADGVISTPTDSWLQCAVVAGEPSDFLVRSDVFTLMQNVSDIPVHVGQRENTSAGANVMARLDAHIRKLGGSYKKRKTVLDEFSGGKRTPWVHYGVRCLYRLTSAGGVVLKED